MSESNSDPTAICLESPAGMRAEINANGSLRRFACEAISLSLFVGNELEGGPANLYLRRAAPTVEWTPLIGPFSATRFHQDSTGNLLGIGRWRDINYAIVLVLARTSPAWFWHVWLENVGEVQAAVDLTYVQDLALAPYGAVRLNEYYVSQYVDHTALSHDRRGLVVASRQNQAADGCNPWSLIGSLRRGVGYATDAKQFHGFASRSGDVPIGLRGDLPGRRLQHEHSMVVIRDEQIRLEPHAAVSAGFFGSYLPHHPDATAEADLAHVDAVLAIPEASQADFPSHAAATPVAATLFSSAPMLEVLDLDPDGVRSLFGPPHRHEERDESGRLLSFFHGSNSHVVLREKELRVQRPHGHILRTGRHLTPDESGLTSTAWMSGVFHSMVTQGHVSINRFLSTVHSYLGLFRSHGQRAFVELDGQWHLLGVPSAFEMGPDGCRWIYRHLGGIIEVRADAHSDPHELSLSIEVKSGNPTRFLISHHVALNGDDGSVAGTARWRREDESICIAAAPDGDVGLRFPDGYFRITPRPGTSFQHVGGDEWLFLDGGSRQQPFLCVVTAPATSIDLGIRGRLIDENPQSGFRAASLTDLISRLTVTQSSGALSAQISRLAEIVPWLAHNALVHYLSPRGLEQYSGGGWGTRDVCQGPVELLLATGRIEAIRDLLLRVMSNQNPDGDWPQWFTFFDRDRHIRADDAHGDIVFWPVLVLAEYLITSGDAGILDEPVRFFDSKDPPEGESATVWQHALRALALIEKRVIPGTALAAYGHGDWNDALQPADPVLRESMCSAWTVTLHFQTLTRLAAALRAINRPQEAVPLESAAQLVKKDCQRLLLVDGVLAGYAQFESPTQVRYLLHPRDEATGIRYSALAMIHAILEDVLTPEQAREHLRLIDLHLTGPDGVRLFDRPMPYHGGPQRIFQRAETATFFGREIGLMYTHAHLRYAQALAHVGNAEGFFKALGQANPIAIESLVPTATLRQSNCYYSSSDAAFEDRYQASDGYQRIAEGTIALDGGWRVYSSGAGIALGLIFRCLLGISCEAERLRVDPVMPPSLNGLRVTTNLHGRPVELRYDIKERGCGVNQVLVNGAKLSFERAANPHRPGAALISMSAVLEKLTADRNLIHIGLG
jgi:1,2-beta-oligoglucan phosphorylase